MNMFSTDDHHELVLWHITIDFVYNFKEFTKETIIRIRHIIRIQ